MHSMKKKLFNSDKFIAHVNKNHIVQSRGYQNLLNANQKLNQDAGQKLFLMH